MQCLVGVLTLLASVTTTSAGAREISEAEFLARIGEDHPATRALREVVAHARGARRATHTENPALTFERDAPTHGTESTLTLSWQPPFDGRRSAARAMARASVSAAEARLDHERLALRSRLRGLFARWWLGVERRELFTALGERTNTLAARARARAASGEASGLSARRLELAAAEASAAHARAEVEVVRALAEVRALVPQIDEDHRPTRPALDELPPGLDASQRGDLIALAHDLEGAERQAKLSGRLRFPTLVGGWTFIDEPGGTADGPVFGLEWSLPLFDPAQGERAAAAVEAEAHRSRLDLEQARAEAHLRAAIDAYEQLRRAAEEMLRTTDGTAGLIDAATLEFQAGEASVTDLLDTLRAATEGRLTALELHHEALAAHRDVERAGGHTLTHGDPR